MAKIVQNGNPVLRSTAKPVPIKEIGSPKIKKILKQMSEALAKEDDGVALAAPQIGELLQIFIVSGKVSTPEGKPLAPDLVFINPEIIKTSRKKVKLDEGCLSVRWWYGKVKRADKVTLTAYDENGKRFTRHASGLWAQIFQHETDHLNGVLFIDKAEQLEEIDPKQLS